jgi:hypothetical protein
LKTQIDDKKAERDLELENIVGNLLIAEYQVEKLRGRLVDTISKKGSKASSYVYTSTMENGTGCCFRWRKR